MKLFKKIWQYFYPELPPKEVQVVLHRLYCDLHDSETKVEFKPGFLPWTGRILIKFFGGSYLQMHWYSPTPKEKNGYIADSYYFKDDHGSTSAA